MLNNFINSSIFSWKISAMLTPEQSQVMTDIAKDFQAIVSRLDSKHLLDKDVSNKLPTQLMRLYISTL